MKNLRTPLLLSSLALFMAGFMPPVNAGDTLQTLDEIVSQPSDIPELLLIKPSSPPGGNNAKDKAISSPSGQSLDNANLKAKAEITALTQQNMRKDKQIVDLTRQLAASQAEKIREQSGSAQVVAEITQQLEEKERELAELVVRAENAEASVVADTPEITAEATERERQIATLQEKITGFIATDITEKLEFAAVKVQDSREIERLNAALKDNQAQVASLTGQIVDLTGVYEANIRAMELAEVDSGKVASLTETLTKSQEEVASLTGQVTALMEKQSQQEQGKADRDKALTMAQQSLAESQKQRDEFQTKWQDATATLTAQTEKLAALQKAQTETVAASVPVPQPGNELQAYALGTLWGQEVTAAVAKMTSEGYSLIQQQVISGVNDALTGSFKVPREKVIAELNAIKQQVTAGNSTTTKTSDSDATEYLATFSKLPGAKKADMGYYYRITAKGEGKIKKTDQVAIVVKESLANGRVIKDMAKSGKVLALPLGEFPPLFASAIGQMRNKGTMIMAVPPAMAYGDQGKPPEIPPNSTMVYEIKVVDVRPASS
jgi:FKBP-type peptidyl-prolyl cis-trans isomerase